MESSLLKPDTSSSPHHSSGPTPPPRNSMEDADSSVKRKRPRLDSGQRTYQNMGAELASSEAADEHNAHNGNLDDQVAMSFDDNHLDVARASSSSISRMEAGTPDQQLSQEPVLSGTPSKVTLNLREHGAPSPSIKENPSEVDLTTQEQPNHSLQQPHTDAADGQQPAVASPATLVGDDVSPGSIEIEAAEPEYIDNPAEETVWRSVVTEPDYAAWNRDVMSRFPVIGRSHDPPHESFVQYWRMLIADPANMSDILRETNTWLTDYLNESAGWNDRWSELFLSSAPWWYNLSRIFKSIQRNEFLEPLESGCQTEVFDRDALVTLLCTLVDLTTRILRADKKALEACKQDRSLSVPRSAREYLQAMVTIFANKQLISTLEALEFNSTEPEPSLDRLQESLYQEYSFLRAISDYWLSALDQNLPDQDLMDHLIQSLRTACDLAYFWLDPNSGSHASQLATCYCDFFLLLADKMSFAVKKQFAMINSELLTKFVTLMSSLIPRMLWVKESLISRITPHHSCDFVEELETNDKSYFASVAWRLDFLEKCVREGRMETSIAALECLSKTLIDVYRDHISPGTPPFSPIVQWTSERLKHTKIIDYLFGVESHPQIVIRSNNVVGFLAASHTYSDEQTDMIWECARATEDPRMFDAIVSAMSTTFGLLERPALHYFCEKLNQISTTNFNLRCRIFFNNILHHYNKHYGNEEILDLLPYRLLLRLLRDVGSESDLPADTRLEVWNYVSETVKRMHFTKWDLDQRLEIYAACLRDLELKDGKAVGSCLMLNRLLFSHGLSDLTVLQERTELVTLVISEFTRLKSIQSEINIDLERFGEPVKEMLQIIEKILLWSPDAIPSDLIVPLWTSMVGADAVGKQARNNAWESLAIAASNTTSAIAFLDAGVSDFLPTLDPTLYCRSLLSFAHRLSEYQSRINIRSPSEANASAGMHESLFWQIALDSLDDQMSLSASKYLVDKVVHEARSLPKDQLSDAQSDFIRRAVTRLIEATLERKQVMDHVHSSEGEAEAMHPEVRALTVRFHRAFLVLKQLGQGLKGLEQQQSPTQRSASQTSRHSIHGDRLQIKYQTSDRGVASPIKSLEIGDQSTVRDLADWIRAKTGFSKFNLIAGGQKLDQEAKASVKISEANFVTTGLLLVHKIPGTETIKTVAAAPQLKPLEKEIMKYFSQLYDLLSVDRFLGQSILDFLVTFPPHEDIVRQVTDGTANLDTITSLSEPNKLIYSLHAMQYALHRQNDEGAIDDEFMVRCVSTMVDRFLALKFTAEIAGTSNQLLAFQLIHTLTPFLKERVQPQVRERYFASPDAFVDQVLNVCQTAAAEQLCNVNQNCFAVLLEAVLLNSAIWERFTSHPSVPKMFKLLLLTNPKAEGREIAKKSLLSVLATLPRIDEDMSDNKDQYKKDMAMYAFEEVTFVNFVWQTLLSILPSSAEHASNSAQFFELSVEIFMRLNEISPDLNALQHNLNDWLLLLLGRSHDEILGQDRVDQFVRGLSELVYQCFMICTSLSQRPKLDPGVVDRLLSVFLFPPIETGQDRTSTTARAPILSSETRRALYTIVVRMCADNDQLLRCIDTTNKALGDVADFNVAWNYERNKHVRSTAGYPGLINLSNTCYLNSLMTQLFMNPRFREFILGLELQDQTTQRLLFALRQLFVDLQDGWSKAILTQELADAIETYEGPLDPAIQMDADEAFNLIFDRIESQLSSAADKQRFKSIFGGQIVQQIKSKECDHISERLEPVTAVQCDIQGKMGLEDSLKAYIEGETMEGDNKYKCSTCDRYVNAVKRACLRDVPDNLIFHLKRFDYDLVQGTRNKLNDFFSFPERVDMTPYTDKYLQSQDASLGQDTFLLTGVLVHSGTAELGHYYSFIRERPLAINSWVEFNDSDVSRYDIRTMQDHCFGGDSRDQYTSALFPKMYSAYMLFYQRETSIARDDDFFKQQHATQVVRAQIPTELALDVATRNERLARLYCLFDPTHEKFLSEINTKRQQINGRGNCTSEHRLETTYIECLWQHILSIFGREHQRTGCGQILSIITDMMIACNECCTASIDWLLGDDETRLRLLLLRQPEQGVRSKVGSLLRDGMIKLKTQSPSDYGSPDTDFDMDEEAGEGSTRIDRFKITMARLRALQNVLPAHIRPWLDFYELLVGFANFGAAEKVYLHHVGFLQHALEILAIDNDHDWSSMFRHQSQYMKQLEKRTFSLVGLGNFIGTMLPFFRASLTTDPDDETCVEGYGTVLSRTELGTIEFTMRPTDSEKLVPWIVERLATSDDVAVTGHRPLRNVVRWMVENDEVISLNGTWEDLINIGLEKTPAWLAEPYLHIALAYVESSMDAVTIELIIKNICQSIKTIGTAGGMEHYEFFKRVRHITNARAFPDRPDQIRLMIIRQANLWVYTLLMYPKESVGEKTRLLVEDLLFPKSSDDEDEELADAKATAFNIVFQTVVRDLHKHYATKQHIGEHCLDYVKFCENALPYAYRADDEETRAEKISGLKRLIEGVQGLIVVSDDGSNANADSDDMSETSSTYGNPGF